jgi:ATP-binding cassette subfamily B protein
MGLLGRDLRGAVLLGVASVLVAIMQFLDPLLFGRIIDVLTKSRSQDDLFGPRLAELLAIWGAIGVAGIAAQIGIAFAAERLAHRNRLKVMQRFYDVVLRLPLAFHGDMHSGRLMKTMQSGAEALFFMWLELLREQLTTFFLVICLLPLTLLLNWRLAIALFVLVVIVAVFTALVIKRTAARQLAADRQYAALAGTAQDSVANLSVVQAFNLQPVEMGRFGEVAREVVRHQFPVLKWWAVLVVGTRTASTLAVVYMVVIGALLHLRGEAAIGDIVSFMGLATLLVARLEVAIVAISARFAQWPAIKEFLGVLDREPSIRCTRRTKTLGVPRGEVSFEGVSFAYPESAPVLSDVSFVARPGTTTALVGRTGAGKTTAMSLLLGLWNPTAGRLLIDGQDLREVELESLRTKIGVVFQETMLFNRSIADNLRVGRPEASDVDLEQACRLADAHEFIVRLKDGYQTMVGERGSTLSGGQRQRLAIARALLKDPPILILDEATSALDAATEARVAGALRTLMAGRTTFVIAHRLSTVRHADQILVFDGGRIVERGSFPALLARKGVFASLAGAHVAGPRLVRFAAKEGAVRRPRAA